MCEDGVIFAQRWHEFDGQSGVVRSSPLDQLRQVAADVPTLPQEDRYNPQLPATSSNHLVYGGPEVRRHQLQIGQYHRKAGSRCLNLSAKPFEWLCPPGIPGPVRKQDQSLVQSRRSPI